MKRRSISIQLMGGFGNQVFQLSQALSLLKAETSIFVYQKDVNTEIDLVIDNLSREGIEIHRMKKLRQPFALFGDRCVGLLLASELGNRRVWFPILTKSALKIFAFFIFRTTLPINGIYIAKDLGSCKIEKKSESNLLIGYFQTFLTTSDKPVFDLVRRSTSKPNSQQINAQSQNLINGRLVVHIRLGDYLKESEFGVLGVNFYRQALEFFKEENVKSVMIFSDDISLARKIYEESIESKINEVFGFEVEIAWIQSVNGSTLDTFNLMRTGSHFVIGNSSFSWWAARLSEHSHAMVVAPKPWFRGIKSPANLYPPEWITLDSYFER